MKTEQLAEKAKEYANIYAREVQLLMQHPGSRSGCFNGYIKGYEEANTEWQEKLRWIPVRERLPEMGKYVDLKIIAITDFVNSHTGIYTNPDGWLIMGNYYDKSVVTHWREKIE